MLNKQQKSRETKTKNKDEEKAFQRQNKTGNKQNINDWRRKLYTLMFWCGSFHEQKQRTKAKKERDKNKEA